jgi:hypothetical protein
MPAFAGPWPARDSAAPRCTQSLFGPAESSSQRRLRIGGFASSPREGEILHGEGQSMGRFCAGRPCGLLRSKREGPPLRRWQPSLSLGDGFLQRCVRVFRRTPQVAWSPSSSPAEDSPPPRLIYFHAERLGRCELLRFLQAFRPFAFCCHVLPPQP